MKKFLLMLCLMLLATNLYAAETLKFASSTWAPYQMDLKGAQKGFIHDIVEAVYAEAGYQVQFDLMPYERSLKAAEKGEYLATLAVLEGDSDILALSEEAVGIDKSGFFVTADNSWTYQGVASLEGKTLATIAAYQYGDAVDAYIEKNKGNPKAISEMKGDAAEARNLKKLLAGRVDVVIENVNVFPFTARGMGQDGKIKPAGALDEEMPLYVAFSPKYPDSQKLQSVFNDGVKKLRASSKLPELLNAYGLNDWK